MHSRVIQSSILSKLFLLMVLAVPGLSHSAGISIQSGASISFNGGGINLGCTDLHLDGDLNLGTGFIAEAADILLTGGSLDAGSGSITLAGDWSNAGTFSAATSQVNIVDGCSTTSSSISGDTSFYSLLVSSTSGKALQLAVASNQIFTNSLSLQGAAGMLLQIRSSNAGDQAFFELVPGATQNIFYVDVADNSAIAGDLLAPGSPVATNSVNSGNNLNWFNRPLSHIPIPTLSLPALVLFMLIMLFAAFRSLPIINNTNR